ncbi:MAG: hypothetical protein KGH60_03040 [Candidatus Micrarchaeota archaeon]|nr:hypothetical protein [Candidatus Micrarchaeota archaeon]
MVIGEKVIRKTAGVIELSSDERAVKELNYAIDSLAYTIQTGMKNMTCSWEGCLRLDIGSVERYNKKISELSKRIDQELNVDEIKLTEWEHKVFKCIGEAILNNGSWPITLDRIERAAGEKDELMGWGASVCVPLLKERGIIKSLNDAEYIAYLRHANPEREIGRQMRLRGEERPEVVAFTEKGKVYYSRYCI